MRNSEKKIHDDLTTGRRPNWRLVRMVMSGLAGAAAITVGVTTSASANYPDPPDMVQSLSSETAPATCPTWAPAGTFPAGTNVKALCDRAVAGAPSDAAAAAIRYMFSKLGASYSQSNRYSINPPVFDCTSFVSRAYTAAKAPIIRNDRESTWMANFGWTGAYMPSAYEGTNLQRLTARPGDISGLLPGDVMIQFSGSNPAGSAGNNGHAQVYLGDGLVIQSGGNHPQSLANVTRHSNWFNNEWYFRYQPAVKFDPIYAKWRALNGASGVLGKPVAATEPHSSNGLVRRYERGRIFWSQRTGANMVTGAVLNAYAAMGYEKSPLGLPTTDETPRGPIGFGNNFEGGIIIAGWGTGTHAVYGAIGSRYLAMGAEKSALGLPTSGEIDGPFPGSRMNRFQNGILLWSPETGTHILAGAIGQRYDTMPAVRNILRLPTSSEQPSKVPGSPVQRFQGGVMYWAPQIGPVEVYGGILAAYQNIGAEASALGIPTAPERNGAVPGSRIQEFSGGYIVWTPTHGAHAVYGAFADQFRKAGGESALGAPVTGVAGASGVLYQTFQRGMIAASNGQSYVVAGEFIDHYRSLGAERSVLGLPVGPATAGQVGGVTYQPFQGGRIYRSSSGVAEVYGGILAAYLARGGERSNLGAPTSGEQPGPLPGSRMNSFVNGAMIWSAPTGTFPMVGDMWKAYEKGKLATTIGLPVGSPRGAGVDGVATQDFTGGAMFWSQSAGAHPIYGAILARYNQLGGARTLGPPTSGETDGPVAQSRMSTLTDGAIIWAPQIGAQPIRGAMWKSYRDGKLAGTIGLPMSTPKGAGVPGAAMQEFQRGAMFWSEATGAHEVSGGIGWLYRAMGGAASKLGLPTSGEYSIASGRAQNFQRGQIVWDSRTGVTQPRY